MGSSLLTIVIQLKDGSHIQSESAMDDIGHGYDPVPIALMDDSEIIETLNLANNGTELINVLDSHYNGMFRSFPLTEKQLENNTEYLSTDWYDKENQQTIASVESFKNVEIILISDQWASDYGKVKQKYFIYDPKRKTGHTLDDPDEYFQKDEDNHVDDTVYLTKSEFLELLGTKSVRRIENPIIKQFIKGFDDWEITKQKNGEIGIWYTGPIFGVNVNRSELTVEILESIITELMSEVEKLK